MRYREKSVILEAFQYRGECERGNGTDSFPDFVRTALENGVIRVRSLKLEEPSYGLYLSTLRGTLRVLPGDYLVKGVDGELYPYPNTIFEKWYEPIGSGTDLENPTEEGWISVEERLPEESGSPDSDYPEYQVTFSYKGYADVRHYPFGGGHWWWNGEIMDPYVTAWRPLPKPDQSKKRKQSRKN